MELKLFNRWDMNVEIVDKGLKDYLTLKPISVPRTGARYARTRFWKSKYPIVERLINKLMVPGHRGKKHKISSGHCCGKGVECYNIVKKAFELIEKNTNKNPVEVFIRALENAAPREEVTTIEYGGAKYPQSADCAPQRRIDIALRMMTQGAYQKTFNSKKKMHEGLADEIIKAYNLDSSSAAVTKKLELERQADVSR